LLEEVTAAPSVMISMKLSGQKPDQCVVMALLSPVLCHGFIKM